MKLDNRLWYLVTAVLCIAIVAGGYLLGVQPQLAAAATSDSSRQTVEGQTSALRAEIASLKQADSSELAAKVAKLQEKVPTGVAGGSFIAEVNEITSSSGATLQSLTLAAPAAYLAPGAAAAATSSTAGAGATSGSSTASASASPSASASAGATTAPVPVSPDSPLTNPAITGANFVIVPVDMTVLGSSEQVLAFLSKLHDGGRLALITKLTLDQDSTESGGGGFTMQLSGSIFVLRDPATTASTTTAATGDSTSNG